MAIELKFALGAFRLFKVNFCFGFELLWKHLLSWIAAVFVETFNGEGLVREAARCPEVQPEHHEAACQSSQIRNEHERVIS